MYRFFLTEYHLTNEEVDRLPLYLACTLLGAISPDHQHLRMTQMDLDRYFGDERNKALARMWKGR